MRRSRPLTLSPPFPPSPAPACACAESRFGGGDRRAWGSEWQRARGEPARARAAGTSLCRGWCCSAGAGPSPATTWSSRGSSSCSCECCGEGGLCGQRAAGTEEGAGSRRSRAGTVSPALRSCTWSSPPPEEVGAAALPISRQHTAAQSGDAVPGVMGWARRRDVGAAGHGHPSGASRPGPGSRRDCAAAQSRGLGTSCLEPGTAISIASAFCMETHCILSAKRRNGNNTVRAVPEPVVAESLDEHTGLAFSL